MIVNASLSGFFFFMFLPLTGYARPNRSHRGSGTLKTQSVVNRFVFRSNPPGYLSIQIYFFWSFRPSVLLRKRGFANYAFSGVEYTYTGGTPFRMTEWEVVGATGSLSPHRINIFTPTLIPPQRDVPRQAGSRGRRLKRQQVVNKSPLPWREGIKGRGILKAQKKTDLQGQTRFFVPRVAG